MTARIAGIVLRTAAGADLADRINPRLIDLTLSEKREAEADELSIVLHNHDGRIALPEPDATLLLQLGWRQEGLVDKGRFTVDEVAQDGPPDKVTIRARSADLTGLYRKRRTRSWRQTTLGAILREIAGRHGAQAKVGAPISSIAISAIEQEGASDMAFVRQLGKRYDAVATWKGGQLLFLPIGASATAGGTALPTVLLTRQQGWRWRFSQASRDSYDGAEAQWHDQDAARRRTVGTGGANPRRLKRVYATEVEAQDAAKAAATRDARRPYSFEYELGVADPALQPDQRVTLQGWGTKIDGIAWLIQSVETSYGAGGLTQRITMESAPAAE